MHLFQLKTGIDRRARFERVPNWTEAFFRHLEGASHYGEIYAVSHDGELERDICRLDN